MSYSRWLGSHWYTFYLARDTYERDEQCFEICSVHTFTYKELTTDIKACLKRIRELDPEATNKEINELRGYMQEFICDVKEDARINYYEQLKEGDYSHLDEAIAATKTFDCDQDFKDDIDEAEKVIKSDRDKLPLLLDVRTKLGRLILERRLKLGL